MNDLINLEEEKNEELISEELEMSDFWELFDSKCNENYELQQDSFKGIINYIMFNAYSFIYYHLFNCFIFIFFKFP